MPTPRVEAMSLILRLARVVRTRLDQRFEVHDLTSQQAGALIHIFGGVSSPRRLADLLGTDTAGTTRLLNRLESKALIVRRRGQADRRAVVLELTDAGRASIPSLPPIFEQVASEGIAGVSSDDLAIAMRVLAQMLEQLEEVPG